MSSAVSEWRPPAYKKQKWQCMYHIRMVLIAAGLVIVLIIVVTIVVARND